MEQILKKLYITNSHYNRHSILYFEYILITLHKGLSKYLDHQMSTQLKDVLEQHKN